MTWKMPPIIKVYEALGSIGDQRVMLDGYTARVSSSEGNKHYDVIYDPAKNAIRANDNASYWAGYLGYPSVAYVLASEKVPYDPQLAQYLKGFAWKEINNKFKNNWDASQAYIDAAVAKKHDVDVEEFHRALQEILAAIQALKLEKLPRSQRPPTGS